MQLLDCDVCGLPIVPGRDVLCVVRDEAEVPIMAVHVGECSRRAVDHFVDVHGATVEREWKAGA